MRIVSGLSAAAAMMALSASAAASPVLVDRHYAGRDPDEVMALKRAHLPRVHKHWGGGKRYVAGRYKGSPAAKRATARGGNPAAQR